MSKAQMTYEEFVADYLSRYRASVCKVNELDAEIKAILSDIKQNPLYTAEELKQREKEYVEDAEAELDELNSKREPGKPPILLFIPGEPWNDDPRQAEWKELTAQKTAHSDIIWQYESRNVDSGEAQDDEAFFRYHYQEYLSCS